MRSCCDFKFWSPDEEGGACCSKVLQACEERAPSEFGSGGGRHSYSGMARTGFNSTFAFHFGFSQACCGRKATVWKPCLSTRGALIAALIRQVCSDTCSMDLTHEEPSLERTNLNRGISLASSCVCVCTSCHATSARPCSCVGLSRSADRTLRLQPRSMTQA